MERESKLNFDMLGDGCSYHPRCLSCDLAVCRYDVKSLASAKRLTKLMAERRNASQKILSRLPIPVDAILAAVASDHSVTTEDITGPSRQPHIYAARQDAAIRLRQFPELTLETIGKYLGNRNHSTILHALRKNDPNWHHNKKRLAQSNQNGKM